MIMGDTSSGMASFSALPALQGTPKQIDWATDIRSGAIESFGDIYSDFMEQLQRVESGDLGPNSLLDTSSAQTLQEMAGVMPIMQTQSWVRSGDMGIPLGDRRRLSDGTYNAKLSEDRLRVSMGGGKRDEKRERALSYGRDLVRAARARLQTETRAEWWIDHRSIGRPWR